MHPSSVRQSVMLPLFSNSFSMPLFYTFLLGLLLLQAAPSCCSAAANTDTLTEGQVLAVGDKLVSINGKFALGFFQYQPANTTSSHYTKSAQRNALYGCEGDMWVE
ncbi:hypothetical protein ACQ4PT_029277 [Festuca glaucescens]